MPKRSQGLSGTRATRLCCEASLPWLRYTGCEKSLACTDSRDSSLRRSLLNSSRMLVSPCAAHRLLAIRRGCLLSNSLAKGFFSLLIATRLKNGERDLRWKLESRTFGLEQTVG